MKYLGNKGTYTIIYKLLPRDARGVQLISSHLERVKICVGAWNKRNHFYLHANPRKTHFEATATISVGLRDYQNDRARSTLARTRFSALFEVK